MSKTTRFLGRVGVLAATIGLSASPALAQPLETVASFEDARGPRTALVQGPDGAFYGTTHEGGAFGGGVVFRLSPAGASWRRQILHSFGPSTGQNPRGGLVVGPDGALYGTTFTGGSGGTGTVYRLSNGGGEWTLATIHPFDGTAGQYPAAGVVFGPDGALYGTTSAGGLGYGTVFRLTGAGTSWTVETLWAFAGGASWFPESRLLFGADGALYGTTSAGGLGSGTVFRLSNAGGPWDLLTLHTFTGADGATPRSGLTVGNDGALYGTTEEGGTLALGTVFRIAGAGTAWSYDVLHEFNSASGAAPVGDLVDVGGVLYGVTRSGGAGYGTVFSLTGTGTSWTHAIINPFDYTQGGYPRAGVAAGSDGSLYGATEVGGSTTFGVAYRLAPSAGSSSYEVLSEFGGVEGKQPQARLVQGADGAFYGTTSTGGASGAGTVFRLAWTGSVWTRTVIHTFSGPDGSQPRTGLTVAPDGALYGATEAGGQPPGGGFGGGTVFRLTPAGASWTHEVLYVFSFPDGTSPAGPLAFGPDGALTGRRTPTDRSSRGPSSACLRALRPGRWRRSTPSTGRTVPALSPASCSGRTAPSTAPRSPGALSPRGRSSVSPAAGRLGLQSSFTRSTPRTARALARPQCSDPTEPCTA